MGRGVTEVAIEDLQEASISMAMPSSELQDFGRTVMIICSTKRRSPLLAGAIGMLFILAWPAAAQQPPAASEAPPPWAQGRPEAAIGARLAPIAPPPLPTAADKLPIAKLKAPKGFKIEVY